MKSLKIIPILLIVLLIGSMAQAQSVSEDLVSYSQVWERDFLNKIGAVVDSRETTYTDGEIVYIVDSTVDEYQSESIIKSYARIFVNSYSDVFVYSSWERTDEGGIRSVYVMKGDEEINRMVCMVVFLEELNAVRLVFGEVTE